MESYFVYVIKLNKSPVYYIGSSGKLKLRMAQHKSNLRKGRHRNIKLQRAWDESGSDELHFDTIEVETRDKAFELEEIMILEHLDDPNMTNIALGGIGGDNISRHPSYIDICKEKSATSIRYWYSMDVDQRAAVRDLKGEKNPMYGRNHTEETKKRISEMKIGISQGAGRKLSKEHIAKMSAIAKLRTGDKNPFYGRAHSPETKQLISEKNKGSPSPTRKSLRIDGVIYETYGAAAAALGVSPALITHRVKSKNPKYANYETLGLTNKLSELI